MTLPAYVQVKKIKFADGKKLAVICTDPAFAVSSSVETLGAQTQSSKLSVTLL